MINRKFLVFKSTVDLELILNRQFSNAAVLPLENGALNGTVGVVRLPNISLNIVNVNRPIAIYADRSSEKNFFSVDLSHASTLPSSGLKAQGVSIHTPALFGFNSNLKDLDLRLGAGSKMATIVFKREFFESNLVRLGLESLLEFLDKFNVFSSLAIQTCFLEMMSHIWLNDELCADSSELLEGHIISMLLESLSDGDNRRVAIVPDRQERHEAALKVLSLTRQSPDQGLEIQDLSKILHQSRTSLFNGCKEQFSMSPIQVIRSVRMHQVRHALLDVEFCEQHNLTGVIDVAQHFGFIGRSHFARFYKKEFCETPRQTLQSRRLAERAF